MGEKLQELKEKLDENIWQHGVTTYTIVEKSDLVGKILYQVDFLQAEVNGEVVMFIDENDMLFNSKYMLRSFLVSSVEHVKIVRDTIKIDFKNGSYILIKVIK
jgi:hypothetical protein